MEDLNALRCSVVLPTKDRVEMARTVLVCILNQTRRIDQIVVVDDGSRIPAESTLAGELQRFVAAGIEVVHLRHEVSQGVSTARNAGLERADGDIVMFCDSDDYWHPQKVEVCLEHFLAHPDSHVFVHAFRWIDGTQFLFRVLREGRTLVVPRWLGLMFAFANPSCCCLRKRGFAVRYDTTKRYHEDLDFILRAMERHEVTFRNSFLMTMGRAPGETGGATHALAPMRQGAIDALQGKASGVLEGAVVAVKILYHRLRLRALRR